MLRVHRRSAGSVPSIGASRIPISQRLSKMIPLILAFTFKFFLPLLVLVALVDALTQTKEQRIQRLSMAGYSQRSIAERLGVTRYRVRLALA